MTRRGVMGLAGAVALATLGSCSLFYPSSTIRYRMTVEVDTPHGLRSGSSVIESTIQDGPATGQASGISYRMRGEAVAVDLPGGTLFALLTNTAVGADYHAHLLDNALRNGLAVPPLSHLYEGGDWKPQRDEARRIKPVITLAPVDYPMLVRFGDIADPKSVVAVDSADLTESFGPGVRLKRIVIQVTDDAVTTGIAKRLWWLANPDVMQGSGWTMLPYESRLAINGLYSGELIK